MHKPAIAYLILLMTVTLACAFKPISDWDEIPYMCLVRHDHNAAAVFAELKQNLSPQNYDLIVGASEPGLPSNPFRQNLAAHPDHLAQVLPFYQVKPLYIAAAWTLWKLGTPLFAAMHLVSALAYFLTGWIVWMWVSRHVFGWAAFLAATTLILQPFLLQTARALLPDALGAFLLVAGIYFLWEQERPILGTCLLLLSILARPDHLIFCILFFAWQRRFFSLLSAAAIYLANNHLAHSYGWTQLFFHTFVNVQTPNDSALHISARLYFYLFARDSLNIALNTELLLFFAIAIWISMISRTYRSWMFLCMATILLHQIAFPVADLYNTHRFFAPQYLLILLFAVCALLGDHFLPSNLEENRTRKRKPIQTSV